MTDLGIAAAADACEKASDAAEIWRLGRKALSGIVEIGRELRAVRAELADNQFPQWVADNFGWVGREAEQYIAVANADESGDRSEPLELDASALVLASPAGDPAALTASRIPIMPGRVIIIRAPGRGTAPDPRACGRGGVYQNYAQCTFPFKYGT